MSKLFFAICVLGFSTSGATTLQMTDALPRSAARVFTFSYNGVAKSDRLCESIGLESWSADDAFPLSGAGYPEIYPTAQGRFLAKGGCVRKGSFPNSKLVTPVVFRFNADSTVDKSFKPIVVTPYINPDSDCRARAIVRNSAGDFFWLTQCANARGNSRLPNEVSIYKFSAEGDLDPKFGTGGKLPAPGNQLPISIGNFNNFDVLADGNLALTLCYGTGERCTVYNLSPDRGATLGQHKTTNGLQKINGDSKPIIEPFDFRHDGIVTEEMIPVCQESNYKSCYPYTIPGVSFGVTNFDSFVKRKPILLPQVGTRSGGTLRPLVLQDTILFAVPEFKPWSAINFKFVKFNLQAGKFVPDILGTERQKFRVIDAFTPKVSFNPPTVGVVDDILKEIDLSVTTVEIRASNKANHMRCLQVMPWKDGIAGVCQELDSNNQPVFAVFVSINKDLSIDTSYGDQGYLRIPVNSFHYGLYSNRDYVTFAEYCPGKRRCSAPVDTIRTTFFQ